jgi:hypothetical protein
MPGPGAQEMLLYVGECLLSRLYNELSPPSAERTTLVWTLVEAPVARHPAKKYTLS